MAALETIDASLGVYTIATVEEKATPKIRRWGCLIMRLTRYTRQ